MKLVVRGNCMAIKIFIDQGHNPNNPNAGAEGNGLREQDIVFRIGILLAVPMTVFFSAWVFLKSNKKEIRE